MTQNENLERMLFNGYSVLGLISFIFAFAIARAFTTFYPSTVVVTSGIHFHHFWYGLILVIVSGWIGITTTNQRHRPLLTVIFGFGGGLIADEAGLLLTLGNYHSWLTYPIFVAIVVLALLIILLWHSAEKLEMDLKSIESEDRVIVAGALIVMLGILVFLSIALLGISIFIIGGIVIAIGLRRLGRWNH